MLKYGYQTLFSHRALRLRHELLFPFLPLSLYLQAEGDWVTEIASQVETLKAEQEKFMERLDSLCTLKTDPYVEEQKAHTIAFLEGIDRWGDFTAIREYADVLGRIVRFIEFGERT